MVGQYPVSLRIVSIKYEKITTIYADGDINNPITYVIVWAPFGYNQRLYATIKQVKYA